MQHAALLDTLKRLNWLYGRGDVQSVSFEGCKGGYGIAYAKCPYSAEHSFRFHFYGSNKVKALRHQSRLKGMIVVS